MAEPWKGQPHRPPTGWGGGRGMGNPAGRQAVNGRGPYGRGGHEGGKRSRNRKKVCTRCGRFLFDECTYCPPPQGSKYFPRHAVTFRPCTSSICKRLNYFRNQQCHSCGAFFPPEDGGEHHPSENSRVDTGREDAAKVLQQWVRRTSQVRRNRRFLALIVATQAVWRGAAARRHLAKSRAAAVRVQALARRVTARAQWLRVRCAAVRIQAYVHMRAAVVMFNRKRIAAVTVQAVFRGVIARRQAAKSRAAATRIQSLARGATTRARQARVNHVVARVQARVRMRAAVAMFNRKRTAAITVQAVFRDVIARRQAAKSRAAATRIQSLARGATTRARQAKLNHAVARIQAHARRREAAVVFRRKRDVAIRVQAMRRGMLARRRFSTLKQANWRRKTFRRVGIPVALAIAAAILVGLLFGGLDNALPCQRGNALKPGDAPLVPGECIEGATGIRVLGWFPGFSARPRLSVTRDGRMIAKKPDGAEVVLAGHIPANRRNGEVLCSAERIADIVSGKDEPAYGARSARGRLVLGKEYRCSIFRTSGPKSMRERVNAWLERGGHVGFSPDGDLEVVSSKGTVWWSLAAELAEDDGQKARAGS